MKISGYATKNQILSVLKREGFSPHAIENVFIRDIKSLGNVFSYDKEPEKMLGSDVIYLTDDIEFKKFTKRHLKNVVKFLKSKR